MIRLFSSVAERCVSAIGEWSSRLAAAVVQRCDEITESELNGFSTFGLAELSFAGSDDRERAILWLRRIIASTPAFADAHAMLADALSGDGDPQRAITEMRIAAALAPHRVQFHLSLGRLLREGGHPLEAVDELRRIARPRSFSASVHLELSLALADLGRNAEARDELQKLLKIAPAFQYMDVVLNLIERLDRADQQPA